MAEDWLAQFLNGLTQDYSAYQAKQRLQSEIVRRKRAASQVNLTRPPKGSGGHFLPHIPVVSSTLGELDLAGKQIADFAIHLVPGLVHQAGALGNFNASLFEQNAAKRQKLQAPFIQALKSTYQLPIRDFSNIDKYPGYAFLDALNVASLGAGSYARFAAGGRAAARVRGNRPPPAPPAKRVPPAPNPKVTLYQQPGVTVPGEVPVAPARAAAIPETAPAETAAATQSRVAALFAALRPFRKEPVVTPSPTPAPKVGDIVVREVKAGKIGPYQILARTEQVGGDGSQFLLARKYDPKLKIWNHHIWRGVPKPDGGLKIVDRAPLVDKLQGESMNFLKQTAIEYQRGMKKPDWTVTNLAAQARQEFAARSLRAAGMDPKMAAEEAAMAAEISNVQKAQFKLEYLNQIKAGTLKPGHPGSWQTVAIETFQGHPVKLRNEIKRTEQEIADLQAMEATQAAAEAAAPAPTPAEVTMQAEQAAAEAAQLNRTTAQVAKAQGKKQNAQQPIEIPLSTLNQAEEGLRGGQLGGVTAVRKWLRFDRGVEGKLADPMGAAIVEYLVRDKGMPPPPGWKGSTSGRTYAPTIIDDTTHVGPLEKAAAAHATLEYPVQWIDAEGTGSIEYVNAASPEEALAVAAERFGNDPTVKFKLATRQKPRPLPAAASAQGPSPAPAPVAAAGAGAWTVEVVDHDTGTISEQTFPGASAADAVAAARQAHPGTDVQALGPASSAAVAPAGPAAEAFGQPAGAQPTEAPVTLPTGYVPKTGRKKTMQVTVVLRDQPLITTYIDAVDAADAEAIAADRFQHLDVSSIKAVPAKKPGPIEKGPVAVATPARELPKPKPKPKPTLPSAADLEGIERAARAAEVRLEEIHKATQETLHAQGRTKEQRLARETQFVAPKDFEVSMKHGGKQLTFTARADSARTLEIRIKKTYPDARNLQIRQKAAPTQRVKASPTAAAEPVSAAPAGTFQYFTMRYADKEGVYHTKRFRDVSASAVSQRLTEQGFTDPIPIKVERVASSIQEVSGQIKWIKKTGQEAYPGQLEDLQADYARLKGTGTPPTTPAVQGLVAKLQEKQVWPIKVTKADKTVEELKITGTVELARAFATEQLKKPGVTKAEVVGAPKLKAPTAAAYEPGAKPTPRQLQTNLRARGLDSKTLRADKRSLLKMGVPPEAVAKLQKNLVAALREGANNKRLSEVFTQHFGEQIGMELFGKWRTARGGSGETPLRAAFQAFLNPQDIVLKRYLGRARTSAIHYEHGRPKVFQTVIATDDAIALGMDPEAILAAHDGVMPPEIAFPHPIDVYAELSRAALPRMIHDTVLAMIIDAHRIVTEAEQKKVPISSVQISNKILQKVPSRLREQQLRYWGIRRHDKMFAHNLRTMERVWGPSEQVLLNRDPAEAAAFLERELERFKKQQKTKGAYVDTANQIVLISALYFRPGYLPPNLIGQIGVVMADHYLNPVQVARSAEMSRAIYKADPEMHNFIKAGMQDGLAQMIPRVGRSMKIAKLHGRFASLYGKVLDTPFRSASFMNEARRAGFDTPEKVLSLKLPENHGEFISICRRANPNIIDFGRFNNFERTWVRRVLFFYPWVKGATYWTTRWMLHHPLQSQVGQTQGQLANEDLLKLFGGPVPGFMSGLVQPPDINLPFFGNLAHRKGPGGQVLPRLIDPRSLTVQGTLGEVIQAGRSVLGGNAPASEGLVSLANPLVSTGLASTFRRDPLTGAQFPGSYNTLDIIGQELTQIPALARMFKNMKTAGQYQSGQRDISKALFPYTRGEPVARFFTGISPVSVNPKTAVARGYADQQATLNRVAREQSKHQRYAKDLLDAAHQLGMKWTKLPPAVAQALHNSELVATNRAAWQDEKGGPLAAKDRLAADLNLAVRSKKIPLQRARALLVQYGSQTDNVVSAVDNYVRLSFFNDRQFTGVVNLINKRLAFRGLAPLRISP